MFLRTATGAPVPPTEIVKRLKQVDDRLGLEYVVFPTRDYSNLNIDEHWAITCAWGPNDKRRHLVMIGQLPEGSERDIICFLPMDCSVHDAFNYFERNVKQFNGQAQWENVLSRVHEYNKDATAANLKETKDLAEELIETNAGTLFKEEGKTIPKVFLSKGDKK